MTDRFARSDGSDTAPCDPNDRVYCGGTWRGIINQLPYIQRMGFTAIWISPVSEQLSGNTYEGEAYHGYWTKDLYALNSNFGTEQDLKDLVDAVHKLGMYIMVDIVMNHFANKGEHIDYSVLRPFNEQRFYHPLCNIDWGNQESIEQCWMGNGYVALPDCNTEDPYVVETLIQYTIYLVTNFKVDGLRLDATRNIRKPFWTELCDSVGVYCQGEVWSGEPDIICPYQDAIDGLHNYPVKESATRALATSNGNMGELSWIAGRMQAQCKDVTLFGTFMENHDNPRMASLTTDMSRLKNAAAMSILPDGIPIVFYGQEQALTGANDPANRQALWHTRYSDNELVSTFTLFNRFRNFLGESYTTVLGKWSLLSNSVVSMQKGPVVLVLTNSGKGISTDANIDGFSAHNELVDIMTCQEERCDGTGQVKITLKGDPMVLCPKSLLSGSGICGM
ncbi:glycoside hydrolase family 13 protein [Mycena alexandri]|uniref:alpha-amylase n=1 Tax=Mycena alexandri TaxID=1745969 RepID=A0AAD6T3Y2_9AGAR|nr:glycoside hydrolase family 13 protein [Mycena alexandri]